MTQAPSENRTRIYTDSHGYNLFLFMAAVILLGALLLRLRGLETTGIWGDQSFTLNTAMRWVNGGEMPLAANKSSVGFVNPPMIEYLYAAALRLWPDILSVAVLTLIGGLLAIVVTGWVTARLFGRRAALWAMLFFAVNPWAVFWSQLIWNQTMVPLFATLALGGLLLYIGEPAEQPRGIYLLTSLAATAIMTQLHPGSAVQALTISVVLLLFRRRVRWRHVLAGGALFVLLYVPYLLYLSGTGWADLRAIANLSGQEATWSPASILLSLDLLHAQGLFRAVPYVVRFDYLATILFAVTLVVIVFAALRVVVARRGAAVLADSDLCLLPAKAVGLLNAATTNKTSTNDALLILLLWFLVPLLFYLRSSVYLQNYYLISQWPAHFMILGIGLDKAQQWLQAYADRRPTTDDRSSHPAYRLPFTAYRLLPIPFLALAAYQVYFNLAYQDARAAGDGTLIQIHHMRETISQSRNLLSRYPDCDLAVLSEGHQVENSKLALLQEFTDPERILLADGEAAVPLPSPCAIYLDARPGSRASQWVAAHATPIPDPTITVRDQIWHFYLYQTAGGDAKQPLAEWGWENGATLIGYERGPLSPGEELPLALEWRIDETPPEQAYHVGTYLLAADNQVVAQHDGPGFDSIQWRQGDRFITWFELPVAADLPPGDYQLAIALYTWPDLVRASLPSGENTAFLELLTYEQN
jgi:4-amino-4-deoxy-L-arabinose transferase-like glycosyltransferase